MQPRSVARRLAYRTRFACAFGLSARAAQLHFGLVRCLPFVWLAHLGKVFLSTKRTSKLSRSIREGRRPLLSRRRACRTVANIIVVATLALGAGQDTTILWQA